VAAYHGDVGVGPVLLLKDNVAIGDVLTVSGMGGSPDDQQWQLFAAGDCFGTPLGTSEFHISCSDPSMNGVEDCARNQGDGKDDDPSLINDWLLEGIAGTAESLTCTPQAIPSGGGRGGCGIGYELGAVVPLLIWLGLRRRRSAA
jgi:hypothetical protein